MFTQQAVLALHEIYNSSGCAIASKCFLNLLAAVLTPRDKSSLAQNSLHSLGNTRTGKLELHALTESSLPLCEDTSLSRVTYTLQCQTDSSDKPQRFHHVPSPSSKCSAQAVISVHLTVHSSLRRACC